MEHVTHKFRFHRPKKTAESGGKSGKSGGKSGKFDDKVRDEVLSLIGAFCPLSGHSQMSDTCRLQVLSFTTAAALQGSLEGKTVLAVRRKGKQLWLELGGGVEGKDGNSEEVSLLVHFGMTGALLVRGQKVGFLSVEFSDVFLRCISPT